MTTTSRRIAANRRRWANPPPVIRFGFRDYTRVAECDNAGNPIRNSAGDPFDPPIEEDYSFLTLSIQQNVGTFAPLTAREYKNSVNSAIEKLYPDPDAPAARKVAAKAISAIRPIIDDAIEQAGGTGWRDYLKAFESGMAEVNQQEVAAKALQFFKDSPDDFVRLVRGDKPKEIEKVFGVGSYDVVKEMGARYPTLDKLAKSIERRQAIDVAVQQGREPIEDILKNNRGLMKLPAFFDPTVTAGNKMLTMLGAKVDTKTMDVLMKAVQSNQNLLEALQRVPARQRNIVLKTLSDDRSWIPAATAPVTSGMAISAGED